MRVSQEKACSSFDAPPPGFVKGRNVAYLVLAPPPRVILSAY